MNDADTRIKDLINSAVDHELHGHRSAPPLDLSRLAERPEPARPHLVARWSVPVLAAVVAALLTVGGMLAVGFERDQQVNPPANSGSPAPWATPSVSKIPDEDLEEGARAYAEAMAGAREASEVAGISVGPVSAEDAARFKDSGLWSLSQPPPEKPVPGKSYPFTVRYVAGPSDDLVSIVSGELRDVASGSCPQPFRVRPGHTYLIRCQVTFRAGVTGKAAFDERGPWENVVYSFDLGNSAGRSASPPTPADRQEQAAREYAEAVASAPEANEVSGVVVGPVSAKDAKAVPLMFGPTHPAVLTPGRSYPVTFKYVTDSDAATLLSVEFQNVQEWKCPPRFLARAGHSYLIRCTVTIRAGVSGKVRFTARNSSSTSTTFSDLRPDKVVR